MLGHFTTYKRLYPDNLVRRVSKLDCLKSWNLADNFAAKPQELFVGYRVTIDPEVSDLQENGDLFINE